MIVKLGMENAVLLLTYGIPREISQSKEGTSEPFTEEDC
jgi:hypothetical protein